MDYSLPASSAPGKNTGVSSRSLLQGVFPAQGLTPCLPHCRWSLSHLSCREARGCLRVLYLVGELALSPLKAVNDQNISGPAPPPSWSPRCCRHFRQTTTFVVGLLSRMRFLHFSSRARGRDSETTSGPAEPNTRVCLQLGA